MSVRSSRTSRFFSASPDQRPDQRLEEPREEEEDACSDEDLLAQVVDQIQAISGTVSTHARRRLLRSCKCLNRARAINARKNMRQRREQREHVQQREQQHAPRSVVRGRASSPCVRARSDPEERRAGVPYADSNRKRKRHQQMDTIHALASTLKILAQNNSGTRTTTFPLVTITPAPSTPVVSPSPTPDSSRELRESSRTPPPVSNSPPTAPAPAPTPPVPAHAPTAAVPSPASTAHRAAPPAPAACVPRRIRIASTTGGGGGGAPDACVRQRTACEDAWWQKKMDALRRALEHKRPMVTDEMVRWIGLHADAHFARHSQHVALRLLLVDRPDLLRLTHGVGATSTQ